MDGECDPDQGAAFSRGSVGVGRTDPLRIALVTMPFADPLRPSLALTQLASVVRQRFSDRVDISLHYLNVDFCGYFGREIYSLLVNGVAGPSSGFGDWIFRDAAFPYLAGGEDDYAPRYMRQLSLTPEMYRRLLEEREGLERRLRTLIDRDKLDRYAIVGLTSTFSQNLPSLALARLLKDRNPHVITLMGGANCETTMGATLVENFEVIDFVFSGPALIAFPEFVEKVLGDDRDACHLIPGVFSRRKLAGSGAALRTEIGAELDIEAPIALDYTDWFGALAARMPDAPEKELRLPFETSRGCWWGERAHCTFCGLNGVTMKYRSMSPDRALAQFDELFCHAPRIRGFDAVDNILPTEYLENVFPRLSPPEGSTLFYEIKADLSERQIEVLANAGVTQVQPGIEALATSTLKLMRKGTTAFKNIRFLENCKTYGVTPYWNLLIGFPGEGEEVYRKYERDLPLLTHLPPPMGVYPVRFDRFSPYFTRADEFGLRLEPLHFYKILYPFLAPEELGDIAYYFSDVNYTAPYLVSAAKWLMRLKALVDRWVGAWRGATERPAPRLCTVWEGDARLLVDSRSGSEIVHDVDELDWLLLDELTVPLSGTQVVGRIAGLGLDGFTPRIDRLAARGLVFQEHDRFMSLVSASLREKLLL